MAFTNKSRLSKIGLLFLDSSSTIQDHQRAEGGRGRVVGVDSDGAILTVVLCSILLHMY